VWQKSTEDTIGLYEFYESQRSCFQWPARIQALIFKYDVRHVSTENVRRFLEGSFRRRLSPEQIIDQANRNFDPKHISVTMNVLEPGQNKLADRVDWTHLGLSRDVATGSFQKGFVYIYNFYPATCKSLEEIRGTIVGMYQEVLEQRWVEELRRTYSVHVNREEFESLIKR
jgi:peptidyl-prolyl cis-trans isomerase SurA